MKSEVLQIRPYARLLTMLGDQLIKNERIALVELIKNAYDADASRVEVRFENFRDDMAHDDDSRIVVQDDGVGMSSEIVRTRWMNPAAPHKYLDKRKGKERSPNKKRVIQGEKGIGRFAVLKLGRVITVTTRQSGADSEMSLTYDFSRFDDDFVSENDHLKEIFLDEIKINCLESTPNILSDKDGQGTVIEVRNLKGAWDNSIVTELCRDVSNLTDPVSRLTGRKTSDRFDVVILCNGKPRSVVTEDAESLKALIEDKAVLNISGSFRSSGSRFAFQINDTPGEVTLTDPKIMGLWVWRQRHGRASGTMPGQISMFAPTGSEYACGDFKFNFYIFDFSRGIDGRYMLAQTEKDRLKEHRVYLYRDDMRVYPYGDPDDDWLNIDVTRGTGRAGNFFSNDQLIGWIEITQKGNPNLRDKTNREGLIESGGAARDLVFLMQLFLSYVKQYPFARYQQKQKQRDAARAVRDDEVTRGLAELQDGFEKSGHKALAGRVVAVSTSYGQERKYLSQRAETTEDLAGVGLSVEMASHDIMLLVHRAREIARDLTQSAGPEGSEMRDQADMLLRVLQQITDSMKEVQVLFKSSRRRRKVLRIEPVIKRVHKIYKTLLEQRNIKFWHEKVGESSLMANTTDGAVMQVLVNLFDNACYWLEAVDPAERSICLTTDGNQGTMIFSDSGPGIDPDDLPYIFEPFYSGKGESGRGLGLYIARRLLERHGYRIDVGDKQQRVLSGANIVVSFKQEDGS